ncbi:MAG: Rrf2 family transcriptional regulator [Candidatus Omnitrophica bacterium]|nr:Rrf2 family transcriptional regulator [Candidatus Omnitrophota bacterium]MDD5592193.1 Rrf2 family transcriptional regulator [Candidatus Omnitrophota bacterium]
MKLITRDTDYALRALCFIAKNKKHRVSVGELVGRLKIPRPFLRKILQVLNKKRILKSHKGCGGGFLLAQPVDKIFLAGLIEIFQGSLRLNECFFKKMACPNAKTCALRKKINSIEKYVIRELKSITLASLLRKE